MVNSQNAASLDGILEIETIPPYANSNILPRLTISVAQSLAMRAAVAYWTVDQHFVHSSLVSKLGASTGFLCADFHLPTNIAELCALKRAGANVYLHLTRLAPRSGFSQTGMPPSLLHTKLLLFDFVDHVSEIWIGSHNWTARALQGINVEASVILHVDRSSVIYATVADYLDQIKSKLCEPVDPSLEDYYRRLQREVDEIVAAVELEGLSVSGLAGSIVTIFGTDLDELSQVNRVGRPIMVSVTDSSTSEEYVYQGKILHSGLSTASNPSAGGISFSPRRFAFRMGKSFPRLEQIASPPNSTIDAASYFVTLQLQSLVSAELLEPSEQEVWQHSWDSVTIERLDEQTKRQFLRDKPLFQVPSKEERVRPKRLMLEEKRAAEGYPLVKRKILRRLDP